MKCICSNCKREFIKHRILPPKPFTITKKQWAKIKYGTIFKSENGILRKNINKNKKSFCVVFQKIHSSQYPSNETVYGYNDMSHKYKIVKY